MLPLLRRGFASCDPRLAVPALGASGLLASGIDWATMDWTAIAALIIQLLWAFGLLKQKDSGTK